MSPLLFSLFINSVLTKLKEAGVRVWCGSMLISTLLYAADAVIFVGGRVKLGKDLLIRDGEVWTWRP